MRCKEYKKCPVCGSNNIREYWIDEIGTCEDYYYCETCSYFEEMVYSPLRVGIVEGYPDKYKDRVQELGLIVIKREEEMNQDYMEEYEQDYKEIIEKMEALENFVHENPGCTLKDWDDEYGWEDDDWDDEEEQ